MFLQQCYDILGLNSDANKEQIKKAYLKKAKLIHPDANNAADANLKFQQLNEAYHTLLKDIETPEIKEFDIVEDYKKYGRSVRNKSYNAKNYQKINKEEEDYKNYKPNVAYSDKFMFYVFVLIGINMLVLGIKRLIFVKEDSFLSLTGVVTSIFFLIIIIYGWNLLRKSK